MAVDFVAKQREFTRFIREPERYPAPAEVNSQRMAMYRKLVFTNIESFLSSSFPVLKILHDKNQWLALVQDFIAEHVCNTPYFPEIAEEFLTYLQNERKNSGDLPFMLELAHYEWVEMALANAKQEVMINKPDFGDLYVKTIRLSQLAWPLIYQYPVHRLSPSSSTLQPSAQPTCLVVYRNREDQVRFIETTPATYGLLQFLEESGGLNTKTCLDRMVQSINPTEPDSVRQSGLAILKELAEKNIVTVLD